MTLCRAQTIIARTTRVTHKSPQGLRAFSKYAALRKVHNESQEAPNAKAYLDSGAILGGRNLVDVKKVLVIGSGGLAIGQAGEFDYSGMYGRQNWRTLYVELSDTLATGSHRAV
jgi:carbamoyl-phosphate synthase large subunit